MHIFEGMYVWLHPYSAIPGRLLLLIYDYWLSENGKEVYTNGIDPANAPPEWLAFFVMHFLARSFYSSDPAKTHLVRHVK